MYSKNLTSRQPLGPDFNKGWHVDLKKNQKQTKTKKTEKLLDGVLHEWMRWSHSSEVHFEINTVWEKHEKLLSQSVGSQADSYKRFRGCKVTQGIQCPPHASWKSLRATRERHVPEFCWRGRGRGLVRCYVQSLSEASHLFDNAPIIRS